MKERKSLLIAILLLAVIIAVYWPGIRSPFQFDDEGGIVMNPALWRLSDLRAVLTYNIVLPRPLFNLSLAIDHALWGLNPFGFHVTNLLIHLICALLVWQVGFKILRILGRDVELSRNAGIIAGFLFALHPAASESVIYIWSRSSSLMSLFLLAALAVWLGGIEPVNRLRAALSFILYLMALATKEEAVFFPALLVAMDLCLFERAGRKRRLMYTLPFWLAPVTLLILRWAMGNGGLDFVSWRAGMGDELAKMSHDRGFAVLLPMNFATQCKVGLEYLRILLWPVGLSVDHGVIFESLVPSLPAVLGMFFVMGVFIFFLLFRRRFSLAAVAISFFILPIFIFYLIPTTDAMVERRLYLPLVGFSIWVGALITRAMEKHLKISAVVSVLMILFFALLTHSRAEAWQDKIKLWADAVRESPGKLRPGVTLARYYYESGLEDRAVSQNLLILRMKPDYPAALQNLGLIYLRKGEYGTAERYFWAAIKQHPRADFNARYNLGVIYEETGKLSEADEQYRLALKINPGLATAHFKRGYIAIQRNDIAEAINEFREALKINPEFVEARMNMGNALVDSGKITEGLVELEKAEKIAPDDPMTLYSLGMTYLQVGRIQEARAMLDRFFVVAGSLSGPEIEKVVDQAKKALEDINSHK